MPFKNARFWEEIPFIACWFWQGSTPVWPSPETCGIMGGLYCHGSSNCQIYSTQHSSTQELSEKDSSTHKIPIKSGVNDDLAANLCLWGHNGHMIIHSRETTHEPVSYYGGMRQSQTQSVCLRCVSRKYFTLFICRLCLYLHRTEWNTAEHARKSAPVESLYGLL